MTLDVAANVNIRHVKRFHSFHHIRCTLKLTL